MLALIAILVCQFLFLYAWLILSQVYLALNDHANGALRKTDFNANMYEDVYKRHMQFLEHIWEGSHTKYHRMMARLYSAAAS